MKFAVGLLLSIPMAVPAHAGLGPLTACGFKTSDTRFQKMDGTVPLLAAPVRLSRRTRAELESRRKGPRVGRSRCPKEDAYANRIVGRLLEASGLLSFATEEPGLKISLQCSRRSSLPVARAEGGRTLLIPISLFLRSESEDSIAAVLAHEIAHLTLRHTERLMESISSAGRSFPRVKRGHEREADITGLRILTNAGYDPSAAVDHLRLVDRLALERRPSMARRRGRVHDSAEARLRLLSGQITACRYGARASRVPVTF